MNFSSQSCRRRSSAIPRSSDMAAWVWVLIRPGARMASGRSSRGLGWKRWSISARVPMAAIRSPRIATAPFSITRRCGSIVMTYRALQVQSAGSAASSDAPARRRLKIRGIEWLGEEIFEAIRFDLTAEVDQRDFDIATELPENLPARAAGRSQDLGIGGDCDTAESAHAFGYRFEDRDPLGANGETIGGVLD